MATLAEYKSLSAQARSAWAMFHARYVALTPKDDWLMMLGFKPTPLRDFVLVASIFDPTYQVQKQLARYFVAEKRS